MPSNPFTPTPPHWAPVSVLPYVPGSASPTPPRAGRSAAATISESAHGVTSVHLRTSAGHVPATGHTLARGAPRDPPELSGAPTQLRHSQFERKLAQHPDQAWATRLLHGIDIGYMGPRRPMDAPNLTSSNQHPSVLDGELHKELIEGRIRGPFRYRPLPSLRCSGLGVVPKKANKWRMIMRLSAPVGSINDFIPKDAYTTLIVVFCCVVICRLHNNNSNPVATFEVQYSYKYARSLISNNQFTIISARHLAFVEP